MKIESQDKPIHELLKGSVFFIPRFQRAYSWEIDHVSVFWDDITENLKDAYFIGSMVVYDEGRSMLAVVDGQQRLTTITLLLCAIREGFNRIGREDLALGLQAYIEQKDRENKTIYVLKTESSYPYLQEEVLKSGPSGLELKVGREEEALQKAFQLFNEKIEQQIGIFFSNKEQQKEDNIVDASEWLSDLRDTVFDLKVILVTLDNEDDAYLIFETLNTRGKDLALTDLLRNHFAKYLRADTEVDLVKHQWTQVKDTVESASVQLDPDAFIVHSWQSRYDFVTKAKTFQRIKKEVDKKNAKAHLRRFVSDAEQWRSIFDTDYAWDKNEQNVARSLAALNIFKVKQPTPGILSLIRAYRDGRIKLKVLLAALSDIEKFHFSFNAITSSRSSGGISSMYASFGQRVFRAKDSNQIGVEIRSLKQKLQEREVTEQEFFAGFEQVRYTKQHSSQGNLVRYILKKVAAQEGQPTLGETDDLTIEHLCPQSALKDGVDEQTIGQIGNLILVDAETNQKLSNNNFGTKKKILSEKGYKLPDVLMNAEEISLEVIRENTLRIAKLSREKFWKI